MSGTAELDVLVRRRNTNHIDDSACADRLFIIRHVLAGLVTSSNPAFVYFRPLRAAYLASRLAFASTSDAALLNDFNAIVDYAEMFAHFAGEFIDLRDVTPAPDCLNPEPAIGYPAGNFLADSARALGHNGSIYPSVRHAVGTCLVALFQHAVQSVAQGNIFRVSWARTPTPNIERVLAD
jgi:hypothetical protein